ncbi:MAG: hypothetical protein KDK40_02255, partial [Chlamydiia bacterium]|nr:hypothetical protein [Chlamydiia bacterium]
TPKAIESFSKKIIAMSKYRKSTPIQDKYFWVLLDQAFNNDQSSTLIEALKKTAEQACRSHQSEIAIRSLSLTAKFLPKDAFITLNQRWALYWESRPEGSSNKAKFVDAWELLVKMTKEHLNVELNPSTPQRVENTPNENPTEAVIDPISHQFYRFVQLAENPHSFQSPCSINRTVDELLKILSYLSRQAPDLPAKPWCMATCLNGFLNKLIENQTYQLLSPEAWRNLGDAWSEVHRELILTNRQFDPHSELPAKSLQNILIKKLLGEILANPNHHVYVRLGNPSERMHLHAKLFTALSEPKSPTEILVLFKELYRENEKIDVYSLQLFATITNRLVVEESEIALYQQALNDLYSKLLPHLHRILNDSSNPKGQISCTEVFYRMMSETTPKSSNCMKSKEWLETFEQARKIHIDYAVDKKELWDCFIRLMGSLNINHCFKMENSFNTTFLKRMNAHFHQRSRERSFEDQITNTLTLCLIGCYFLVYIPPEDYETYLQETGELYKKGMFDTKDRLYLIGAWNAATESFEGVLNTLSKGTKGAAVVKTKTFISCKDLLKNAKELINKKMLR